MIYVIGVLLLCVALWIFKNSGSFIKALLTSVVGGVGSLCAVGAVSCFVPLTVGLNLWSLAFCAMFSVPGTVLLLLAKTFLF
ncbi:MAG: pro-sigmaK processing inhibitor BofA family protein [Clostridia bacterium]|nr:pro-sigmaK processing inhibitor BofA family protein [Clostridia bacterium]